MISLSGSCKCVSAMTSCWTRRLQPRRSGGRDIRHADIHCSHATSSVCCCSTLKEGLSGTCTIQSRRLGKDGHEGKWKIGSMKLHAAGVSESELVKDTHCRFLHTLSAQGVVRCHAVSSVNNQRRRQPTATTRQRQPTTTATAG